MSQNNSPSIPRIIELLDELRSSLLVVHSWMIENEQKDIESRRQIKVLMLGELTQEEKKILGFIKKKGGELPRRILSIRYHNTLGSPRMNQALKSLVERGLLQENVSSTKGRPLTTYSFIG